MECRQISLGSGEGSGLDRNRHVRQRWSSAEMDTATVMISHLGEITHVTKGIKDHREQIVVGVASPQPVTENCPSPQQCQEEKSGMEPELELPLLSPSSWIYVTPSPDDEALRLSDDLHNHHKIKSTLTEFCFYCSQTGHRIPNCPELSVVPLRCCRVLDFGNDENVAPMDTQQPKVSEASDSRDTGAAVIVQSKKLRGRKRKEDKNGGPEALMDHNYCCSRKKYK